MARENKTRKTKPTFFLEKQEDTRDGILMKRATNPPHSSLERRLE